MQYIYIFIGGALGAFLRFSLSTLNNDFELPVGTFIVNLVGAFLMGFIGSLTITFFKNYPLLKKAITTGFLGALTTFSTFQFELLQMFKQENFIILTTYGLMSYILGILLCYVGVKLGGRVQ